MAPVASPLFLVGCPRSGTTLLKRILNAHSAVAITPETHFIRRIWLARQDFNPLESDAKFEQLIERFVSMPEFLEMGIESNAFRTAALETPRSIPALFERLLSEFGKVHHATLVGEKTPNHLLYMPILISLFPKARFIHIVRDPRAVVQSWRSVPWSTGTLAGDAQVWRRYMMTARKNPPKHGQALLTLHYESLLRDPVGTAKQVCNFLELRYEPEMLAFHAKQDTLVNTSREPWKKNVERALDPSRLDAWRDALDPSAIARIESIAWPEMVRWGYAPLTPRLALVASLPVQRAKERLHRFATNLRRSRT